MIKIKITKKTSSVPSKLSIFDFDGTLFKSPDKPKNYKGNWWIEEKSLSNSVVGKTPQDSFWNLNVVNQAQQEIDSPDSYTVIMTGRVGNIFEERIKEILNQKNLNFKEYKFNSFGQDAGEFKVEEIKKMLQKHPSIKKIEMWEDEQDKIQLYTKEFSEGYDFHINKV